MQNEHSSRIKQVSVGQEAKSQRDPMPPQSRDLLHAPQVLLGLHSWHFAWESASPEDWAFCSERLDQKATCEEVHQKTVLRVDFAACPWPAFDFGSSRFQSPRERLYLPEQIGWRLKAETLYWLTLLLVSLMLEVVVY